MNLIIVLLGVIALMLLILVVRLHTFLAFICVSLGVGIAVGLSPLDTVAAIQQGMGDTLGFIVLILGLGAMLGTLVADSGAAQRITGSLIEVFGMKRLQAALVLTGFVVGIPMFYNVGFVVMVPLVFSVTAMTRMPLVYVGLPMLASLSVTHGFLPPHPAPSALADAFQADIGLTMIYGIAVAIPAIIVAGPLFSRRLLHLNPSPPEAFSQPELKAPESLPSLGISLTAALMPAILMGVATVLGWWIDPTSMFGKTLAFIGNPIMAMLLSVLVAIVLLGTMQGKAMKPLMEEMAEGVKRISMIMLIISGAGALKQVLKESMVSQEIAEWLIDTPFHPLLLAWGIAAIIRVCVGSATVAGMTTAGIIAPFVASAGISPELMVLAVGAGSLMFSHVNDSGFWMFKEYFGLTVGETLRSWSIMETLVSVMGIAGIMALQFLLG
ncbi:gluconate:H+ symporter [Pontibacter sp. G13]|uniref:gluconate:H+ symporter n=1 Tax=Pontibacter sp. G13 TaxID=3074898 RepID=UPI0028896EF6|nr:gluconate:H+ symporter [Pontibacter sp. G13]WNJ20628.1 gluconate:H+ symporter [Pontibacter sp. G13]